MSRRAGQVIGVVERLLHLKRSDSLRGIGTAELTVMAEHAVERAFRRGDVLLREGESAGSMHVVVEGRVHVSRKGRMLGCAGHGAVVGGFSVFARDPEGVAAVAETDTVTLELESDTVLEIFEDHFAVLHHVLRLVSNLLVDILGVRPGEFQRALTAVRPEGQQPRELDLVQRIFYLRRVPVFSRCSINALSELSRGLTEVVFEPGTPLWELGEPSGGVLMIVSGLALCTMPDGGLFVAGAGSSLGAVDSMAGRPRFYGAVAETRLVALQGPVETLIDVFEDNFEMAMDYLSLMARWLLEIHERAEVDGSGSLDLVYGCDGPDGSHLPATMENG